MVYGVLALIVAFAAIIVSHKINSAKIKALEAKLTLNVKAAIDTAKADVTKVFTAAANDAKVAVADVKAYATKVIDAAETEIKKI